MYTFDSGRTALAAVLEAAHFAEGSVVAVQAFTCIAVPNAIRAAHLTPFYLDIDESFNMNVSELERAITTHGDRLKAVIVQHTFGIPADIERIVSLCHDHGVLVIEDCAHALGATAHGQPVGSIGDAAIFSFGRDKVISTVSGGVALTKRADIGQQLHRLWKGRRYPSPFWIAQRLLHPMIFACALPFYNVKIGVAFIALLRFFTILPLVLDAQERQGTQQEGYRYPGVLGRWAVRQLEQLDERNQRRRMIASGVKQLLKPYSAISTPVVSASSEPVYLRFAALVEDPSRMKQFFYDRGILLGDWYDTPIAPRSVDPRVVDYVIGSCPTAERVAQRVVNIPNQPTMTDYEYARVQETLQEYLQTTYGDHTA